MDRNGDTLGIVLFQLGGPDSLDAVEPFLVNLFSDPDIIDFPFAWVARGFLARAIARRRSPGMRENYRVIGGKSPILEITRRQASALEESLNRHLDAKVVIAMRYWAPFTDTAIDELLAHRISRVVLLPLYPHYSKVTTGSSMNEWNRSLARRRLNHFEVSLVREYGTHPLYVEALSRRIDETLARFPGERRGGVHILFSAHGTPESLVRKGDPYRAQIEQTVRRLMEYRGYDRSHHLSFQSRVGPQKWLEPFTVDMVRRLGRAGVKEVALVPVAFTSDHIETLHGLNILVRRIAEEAGIQQFEVAESLNDSPKFIEALSDLVITSVAANRT